MSARELRSRQAAQKTESTAQKKEGGKAAQEKKPVKTTQEKKELMVDPVAQETGDVKVDPAPFQVAFYMKHFRATDIIVKVADYTLIIDASHREHADEHGLITRSMIRKHKLPQDIKLETLRSAFTGSGFLVFHADR